MRRLPFALVVLALSAAAAAVAPDQAVAPAAPAPAAPSAAASEGQLHADHVRYDITTHVLAAEGNVILTVGETRIHADRLNYDPASQRARAAGTVVLTRGDTTIEAPDVAFDVGGDVMDATGGVRLTQPGATLWGDAMTANLHSREIDARGHAAFVRSAQAPADGGGGASQTSIAAPHIAFRSEAREARADGGVVLTEAGREVQARRLVYSEASARAEFTGQVVATQSAAASPGAAPRPPVIMACDHLTIALATRDMQAGGSVTVSRGARSATGDRAVYTERDHRLAVTGDARMQDADGSRVRADQVTISLTDDAFEASGNVETEFKVTRPSRVPGPPSAP